MGGPDSYYTPDSLAERLLSYVEGNPKTVADFCVGDGGLLEAASNRFKGIACYGIDISMDVIETLKARQAKWRLHTCDFKSSEERGEVPFLRRKRMQLIVLNPPFTCRGSKVEVVKFEEKKYHISTALSFVVASLPYLANKGGLYAILPISCVYSEKDGKCWKYLQEHYFGQVLEVVNRVYFTGRCSPNIAIVYFGKQPYSNKGTALQKEWRSSVKIEDIQRGSLGIYLAKTTEEQTKGRRFIHTTNMRKGELTETKRVLQVQCSSIVGYGVLIPRVCNPSTEKIVVFEGEESVLSDCVVFLKTKTLKQAQELKEYLLKNWKDFSSLYRGTGARYVTMTKLREVFGLTAL